MIRRKSAGHAAVILVAATLLGGCQASAESPSATTATSNGSSPAAASTGVEPSPQASAEAASDSVGPSAAASAAASDSVGPSPAASAAAATLTIKKISTKRWGDAPFKATAAASDGAPVRFGGSGGCTVDPLSGRVTIKAVGTCTVTATAKAGDKTLGASAAFTIEPAQPVIKFGARETRFKSNLHFALNAISVPGIKLGYSVIQGATGTSNDAYCAVTSDGFLVWTKKPTVDDHAAMDAKCMVRVAAAAKSANYVAPKAVEALVHIDYPSWKLNAANQSLSATQDADGLWYVTVTVNEDNGSALGVEVDGDCGSGTTENTNVKVGTKVFKVRVSVNDPSSGAYSCTMHATALPQDYHEGNTGTSDVDFKLTVKP